VQERMATFAPPRIGSSSSVVVIIELLQELIVIVATCTNENLWKTITSSSTNLPVSWSNV
jgi:hypothetical protein